MTVYENLKGMLEDAIALKRPAAEIAGIREELSKFECNTYTEYQVRVVRELTALYTVGACSKKILEKARLIVWDNEDNTFSEESGMRVSEAADLALDLTRVS